MNPEHKVYESERVKAKGAEMNQYLLRLAESINIGIWHFDLPGQNSIWQQFHIHRLLGYLPGQVPEDYHYFLDCLVHKDDRKIAFDYFNHSLRYDSDPSAELRLLTKNQGFRWFKCIGKAWFDEQGDLQQLIGAIFRSDDHKLQQEHLKQKLQLFTDTTGLIEAGGWETDLKTGKISWTPGIYKILEAPYSFGPTIENLSDFFHEEDRNMIKTAFNEAVRDLKPFELDARFNTLKDHSVWIKLKGVALTDQYGKCIGLKGSLQKVENQKKEYSGLQRSVEVLTEQNKRLQNFAHIVSHNLRSYSNNLQFMINLMDDPDMFEEEKPDIFSKIRRLSEKLGSTLHDLDEIVKIHTDTDHEMAEINLETCFKNILNALEHNLHDIGAQINYNFAACNLITYVPAYLDSIFLNLLTNSLKYRHRARQLRVFCQTIIKNNFVYLLFEDNGIGIDMKKYGHKLFGMYNTFHANPDAKGIGLFITKNQVESLGGAIEVESAVDIGTKFSIKLSKIYTDNA